MIELGTFAMMYTIDMSDTQEGAAMSLSKQMHVWIEPKMKAEIRDRAWLQRIDMTELIRRAIHAYLEKDVEEGR